MSFSIIVAIAENNAIGKNNELLWHISDDLKRFKKITAGHTVIMGKKTWESLPVRPLPNRRNIVISDDPTDDFKGAETVYSIQEALEQSDPDEESFVIGGGSIYKQFMPYCDTLYITRVHESFDADTFFPPIPEDTWEEISREDQPMDEKHGFSWSYIVYKKKS